MESELRERLIIPCMFNRSTSVYRVEPEGTGATTGEFGGSGEGGDEPVEVDRGEGIDSVKFPHI